MESCEEKSYPIISRAVVLAVFYGCGIGAGIVSYLARSGVIHFTYKPPFAGSVTIVDVLGYPKQQEVFWYVAGVGLPLVMGLLYGYIVRVSFRLGWKPLRDERGWWLSLLIFILQSPLLAVGAKQGMILAILHMAALGLAPVVLGLIFGKAGDDYKLRSPESAITADEAKEEESLGQWVAPALLVLFAGFVSNEFLTMFDFSLSQVVGRAIFWSGGLATLYYALFRLLLHCRGYPTFSEGGVPSEPIFRLWRISLGDRAAWGLMPVTLLPLYQLAWGHYWVYGGIFIVALIIGAVLFIHPPRISAGKTAMILLPCSIGMALHLNPQYKFATIDVVHEGQQLAFSECMLRGMLPGVEKAAKYGPLYELSEGWAMRVFGAQVSVLRMYFLWAQILGYWFGCLLLAELVKRRWVMVYGWIGYLGFSIAALYGAGRFNGLRAGLPMLAIYLWNRRCGGRGKGWLIAAGAVGAMGAIYSVEFGLAGMAALLAGLVSRGFGEGLKSGLRVVFREAAGMAVGAFAVAAPFALIYIAHGGLLSLISGMYEYAEGFSLGYGAFPFPKFPWLDSELTGYIGIGYFIRRIRFYFPPLVGVAFGGWLLGKFAGRKWSAEHAGMTALWIYSMAAFRSVMGRSDFFHLLQVDAPAIILLFILLDRLWGEFNEIRMRELFTRRLALPVLGVTFSILFILPFSNFKYMSASVKNYMFFRFQKNIQSIEAFYSRMWYVPLKLERAKGIWMPARRAILLEQDTDYILKNTGRDEPLHIAPLSGLLLFLADRAPLTRYCMVVDAVTPETRRQIVTQLMAKRPRLIMIQPYMMMDFSYEEEHPEEVRHIRENYELREKVGDIEVYIRKEGR